MTSASPTPISENNEAPGTADSTAPADAKPFMRTIKSFVKRAGRMGSGQVKAMAELGPQFLLQYQPSAIDFVAAYADSTRA